MMRRKALISSKVARGFGYPLESMRQQYFFGWTNSAVELPQNPPQSQQLQRVMIWCCIAACPTHAFARPPPPISSASPGHRAPL